MTTRKYTPPTCTLEVTTQKPRSRRAEDQDSSEDFQFKLSFDDPRLPEEEYVTVVGDRTQLDTLSETVISYVQDFLNNADWFESLSKDRPKPPQRNHSDPDEIYLKPDGLLYHDLFFGSLATQNSGPFVHLSALQLFDLVTALEECRETVDEVPGRSFSIQFQPMIWLRTLMMILISIGALTGMIKLTNFYRQPFDEALSTSVEETQPPIPPPNLNPPVLPTWPSPTPTPSASPPQVAENLPNVDAAPLPVPPPLFPAPSSPPPPQPIPNVSQQDGMMIILPEPQPATPPPEQPANPPVSQPVNPPSVASAPPPLAPSTPPPIPYSPPVQQVPPVIQLPPLQNATPPQIVTVFPAEEDVTVPPGEEFIDSEVTEDKLPEESYLAQLNKRPETIAATRQEDTTLFDQIPQVNEVRTYFQENWYPPKNLRKALQYRLQLNADGTIASITPLGQAAVNRLSQLELPKLGEPFVSATADGRRPSIRIVLEPSGRVKAFLESFNNALPENSSS